MVAVQDIHLPGQDIHRLVDTPLLVDTLLRLVDTPLPNQDIPLQQGILLVMLQLLVAIPLLKATRQLAVTPLLLEEATHLVQVPCLELFQEDQI